MASAWIDQEQIDSGKAQRRRKEPNEAMVGQTGRREATVRSREIVQGENLRENVREERGKRECVKG